MYYRVRAKKSTLHGGMVVVADNLPSLKLAYEEIIKDGKGTGRVYYIDEVEPKLFSKLTVKVAKRRLDEIQTEERNNDE